MHPSRAIRSAKRNIFADLINIPEPSNSFSFSFDASFLSPAKATSTPKASLNQSTSYKKKQIRKNKNRRASADVEYTSAHNLQSLQQLCQHIMSIEFSLTYGLAVIM